MRLARWPQARAVAVQWSGLSLWPQQPPLWKSRGSPVEQVSRGTQWGDKAPRTRDVRGDAVMAPAPASPEDDALFPASHTRLSGIP